MTTTHPTLIDFLRARLDEDERLARDAAESAAMTTKPPPPPTRMWAHMARHDPARVLADVDAKRRIIDACEHTHDYEDYGWPLANDVLAALALPYADHPDYQEAWRP